MDFKAEKFGDVTVIHIFLSRATLAKAVEFKDYAISMINNGNTKIIADLSICEYIDSTFLGAMVSVLKKTNTMGGDLRLVYNKEVTSLMFVLTRMDKVFKVFTGLNEAIASFSPGFGTLTWK
ncbi:MAG: STAS domain-containing protein [Melioribacteraceae bacterium]|nr:STAS domain-containing protein [Melioribacteraceae bacterium]